MDFFYCTQRLCKRAWADEDVVYEMDRVLFKFLRLYLCRPDTDRISEGVPKKLQRNRNRDSCEKSATGTENTGILRISAGITNVASLLKKGWFHGLRIKGWFHGLRII